MKVHSTIFLSVATSIIASLLSIPSTTMASTRAPRKKPTKPPGPPPTGSPHLRPTAVSKPTKSPTLKPTVGTDPDIVAGQALTQARAAIIALIQNDNTLVPQLLRMGFHDCVGGCDGCIDLTNPDNNGLANAIQVLGPIVKQYATDSTGVTRADIWALAAVTAVDVGNHVQVTTPVSFTMPWYGRQDCETANAICRGGSGQQVPCTATEGPYRSMPSVNLNTSGIFAFFANEFGFSQRETVAVMGGHNVGKLVRTNSGIDGPGGWVPNNNAFVNQYYGGLVGPIVPQGATTQQLVAASPPWKTFFLDNTGLTENLTGVVLPVPSRNYWTLQPPNTNKLTIMTNADISLVRDLDNSNLDPTTGHVSCTFKGQGGSPCPVASSISFAVEFLNDDVWLNEFKTVLDTLTTSGYVRPSSTCSQAACRLTVA